MTNRLFRNAVCILVLLSLGCGLTGIYQAKEAIKQEQRPRWVTIGGND